MWGALVVWAGVVIAVAGLALVVKPMRRVHVPTRRAAAVVAGVGAMLLAIGFLLPTTESRAPRTESRLDAIVPVWQFVEKHTIRVPAPPPVVYAAMKHVRADEILLFRTLTWIRRGGRPSPPSILNAGADESLIDLATRTSFISLADDAPRELVVGTIVGAPPGARIELRPEIFRTTLPDGYALAAMNFRIEPDGDSASIVTTETRVFATGPQARRRFAAYWRVIYPGSAVIRRMWLRAIKRRATERPPHN
jgi:hypothetical protein